MKENMKGKENEIIKMWMKLIFMLYKGLPIEKYESCMLWIVKQIVKPLFVEIKGSLKC